MFPYSFRAVSEQLDRSMITKCYGRQMQVAVGQSSEVLLVSLLVQCRTAEV